jgi:hypothetical protein
MAKETFVLGNRQAEKAQSRELILIEAAGQLRDGGPESVSVAAAASCGAPTPFAGEEMFFGTVCLHFVQDQLARAA